MDEGGSVAVQITLGSKPVSVSVRVRARARVRVRARVSVSVRVRVRVGVRVRVRVMGHFYADLRGASYPWETLMLTTVTSPTIWNQIHCSHV